MCIHISSIGLCQFNLFTFETDKVWQLDGWPGPGQKVGFFFILDTVFGWPFRPASLLLHFIHLKCPPGFYVYANISSKLWQRKDVITTIYIYIYIYIYIGWVI